MAYHRRGIDLGQVGRHCRAKTIVDVVLLGGDDAAGLHGSLEDQRLVQRLDGVDVQHAGADTLAGQLLGRSQRHLHRQARGGNGHIAAVAQGHALAQFKGIAGDGVGHRFDCQAAQAHIRRPVIVQQGLDRQTHLVAVAGVDHHHTGDGTHGAKVLDALVGRAVLADGQAAVRADDLHVQARIRDGVAHLLEGTAGSKHGKGVGKRHFAAGRQTGGHAHHVALGNAHVEKAIRIGLGKALGHGCAGQVRIQDHQLGILLGQGDNSLAICAAGCNFLSHLQPSSSFRYASSSEMATAYCSSLGALPCQPALFSI